MNYEGVYRASTHVLVVLYRCYVKSENMHFYLAYRTVYLRLDTHRNVLVCTSTFRENADKNMYSVCQTPLSQGASLVLLRQFLAGW